MSRKRHTAEQIIAKLREAEIELAKGQTTAEVVRKFGITEQTNYRCLVIVGGGPERMSLEQARYARWAPLAAAAARQIRAHAAHLRCSEDATQGIHRCQE